MKLRTVRAIELLQDIFCNEKVDVLYKSVNCPQYDNKKVSEILGIKFFAFSKDNTVDQWYGTIRQEEIAKGYCGVTVSNTQRLPSTGITQISTNVSLDYLVPQGKINLLENMLADAEEYVNGKWLPYKIESKNCRVSFSFGDFITYRPTGQLLSERMMRASTTVAITITDVDFKINVELQRREPYTNRKIDMNEVPVSVLKIEDDSNIAGWSHNEVDGQLSMYLQGSSALDYNYLRITDGNDKETSWFILQKQYTGLDIVTLTLKRDVIRDNWEDISQSDCLIERGYIESSNALYYKNENFTGNSLFSCRTKLCDSNLILAYVKNTPEREKEKTGDSGAYSDGSWGIETTTQALGEDAIDLSTNSVQSFVFADKKLGRANVYVNSSVNRFKELIFTPKDVTVKEIAKMEEFPNIPLTTFTGGVYDDTKNLQNEIFKNAIFSDNENSISSIELKDKSFVSQLPDFTRLLPEFENNNFPSSIDRRVKVQGQVYRLRMSLDESRMYSKWGQDKKATYENCLNSFSQNSETFTAHGIADNHSFGLVTISMPTYKYSVSLLPINDVEYKTLIYPNFNEQTYGAIGYSILAFRYSDTRPGMAEDSGRSVANVLIRKGVSSSKVTGTNETFPLPSLAGLVMDLQYSPFDESILENNTLRTIDINDSNNNKVGEYYVLSSQDIEKVYSYDLSNYKRMGNIKTRNELSKLRLQCPNNSTYVDIKPDFNWDGITAYFKVSATLKPYSPVYKIFPQITNNIFNLNKSDRNNHITLGGDFSATQVGNAWSDYLVGNKNVIEINQVARENEIESFNIQQSLSEKQLRFNSFNSVINTVQQIGYNPNPTSILSGVMGLFSQSKQFELNNQAIQNQSSIFRNTLMANQKQFNLQLGNIKSQPASIRKISNGSIDNDFSIIIEEYHATEIEYEILDNIFKNIGFTINAIGNINTFLNSEYKIYGTIINSPLNNANIINEINNELQLGIKIIKY